MGTRDDDHRGGAALGAGAGAFLGRRVGAIPGWLGIIPAAIAAGGDENKMRAMGMGLTATRMAGRGIGGAIGGGVGGYYGHGASSSPKSSKKKTTTKKASLSDFLNSSTKSASFDRVSQQAESEIWALLGATEKTAEYSAAGSIVEAPEDSRKRRLAELLKKREHTGTSTGSASPNPPKGS
jgi:hypothetical protein